MPTDHRKELAKIRSFTQLIAYLRDEMGWPIKRDSFDHADDLFYDFTPEELGIDSKNAAKIQEIKRLRPLSINQPWGIFFVKFEPKLLPVGALRRILGQVAIKKRASANSAERAAWSADDLLFVSNYGEGPSRQISFAHFSQSAVKKDLPTLKVLGWNNLDTALHLDDVSDKLTHLLAWPDDEEDANKWRETWRSAFTLEHRQVVNTSKTLSIELARLARNIRDCINTVLTIETEEGPVSKLMDAFKKSLVHDLDEDGFADMYAQTIAYGLLSARVANPSGDTADDLAMAMPVTNPFLKELMETFLHVGGRKIASNRGAGIDFDELGVSEIVELLDAANMEAVIRDFGDRNPREDPVIHFYELFLKEYDAKKRMQRGVFYTPRPVVSFIVRSVDALLRTEFGLEDGLADTTTWQQIAGRSADIEVPNSADPDQAFVQILDPATGTGTFLVEVIDLIHKTMAKKWRAEGYGTRKIEQLWNHYVPQHLLPRLHGYELMMAPYAIAHMKLGLKLHETGYRFESDERARVYLTNSLEPPHDFSGTFAFAIPALAHEAEAVNAIKQNQHFTVVLGNPPYSGVSSNNSDYAVRLVDAYKFVDGAPLNERKLWLQDDYVKFFRFAQQTIDKASCGILGYITNHGYLDNPTFRGMRQSLLTSFQLRQVIDLHGSTKKKETAPDGSPDKNIFDIQQGVAIGLFAKRPIIERFCHSVSRGDLYGDRELKYTTLLAAAPNSLPTIQLEPNSPLYLFAAQDQTNREEYDAMPLLSEIMRVSSVGMVTARDKLTIAFSPEEIWARVRRFVKLDEDEAREEFELRKDVQNWKVKWAQEDILADGPKKTRIQRIMYRPFDFRFTYYTGRSRGFICRPVHEVMQHMANRRNIGLMTTRKVEIGTYRHAIVTNAMTESHSVSLKEINYLFPLWVYPDNQGSTRSKQRDTNFTPQFLRAMAVSLGIADNAGQRGSWDIASEDVFGYLYSILNSPNYRARYGELLRTDFPRVPLISSKELFDELARLGNELIALQLLETSDADEYSTALVGTDAFQVEKVSYSDDTVWIDRAKTLGFRGITEDVWGFHIGGYQVCEKWLKSRQARGGKNPRPGRILSVEEIDHYQKIVVAIRGTIRIMDEIDEVIEEHGGWPSAFSCEASDVSSDAPSRQHELLEAAEDPAPYNETSR